MRKLLAKAGWSALLAGISVAAWAADPVAVLQQPQGKVFVGQGNSMVLAQPGMAVYPGNRVVTAADGQVSVVYTAGCTLPVSANSLLTVKGAEQCKGKASGAVAGARNVRGFTSPAIGQTPADVPVGAYVVGGLLAVSVIAAIASDDDEDGSPD